LVDSVATDLDAPQAPKVGGWGRRWSPLAAASFYPQRLIRKRR